MRTGLFLSALLATALVCSTALADRYNDSANRSVHARETQERVFEKQREGFGHSQKTEATRNDSAAQKRLESSTSHHSQGDKREPYGKAASARSTTKVTRGSTISVSDLGSGPRPPPTPPGGPPPGRSTFKIAKQTETISGSRTKRLRLTSPTSAGVPVPIRSAATFTSAKSTTQSTGTPQPR